MILAKYLIGFSIAALTLVGCNSNESLQRYLVNSQDNDKFLKIDVAASLLQTDNNTLSEEEKEILATVKKINVIAYPIDQENTQEYKTEKEKLRKIINQEEYKTLMTMGSTTKGATLKYLGDENAIDELIVFASDSERGFALFRVLGENMRPDKMIKLMNSIDKGDLDVSQLGGIGDILKM